MKFKLIYLSIIVAILSVLTMVIVILPEKALEEKVFYASANVSDIYGLDLNQSALTFGRVIVNGSVVRSIKAEDDYEFPIKVEVNVNGSITKLISYDKVLYLKKSEKANINFSVYASDDTIKGFYEGFIDIKIIKA